MLSKKVVQTEAGRATQCVADSRLNPKLHSELLDLLFRETQQLPHLSTSTAQLLTID